MIRVLHVTASGEGGGAVHLATMLPALRRLGVHSEVAAGERGSLIPRLVAAGFPVHPLDLFRSRLDVTAPVRLARVIRRTDPDLVHYHGTRAAFFGALSRPLFRRPKPSLYTVHGLSYRKESNPFRRAAFLGAERLACRAASTVISVSRADLADLGSRRLLSGDRGVHIRNPVDTDIFAPGDRGAARKRVGLDPDAFVVGTVSRLVAQKAVNDLVAAASRLPRATFVIVGDGPDRPALERAARPLGDRVLFLGERDDVDDLLRAMDVFALCSRWEGEPLVLLEAMATALPCVAAANAAAEEVVGESGAGRLVPVGDADALVRVLDELHASPETRRELGEAGRRAVLGRSPDQLAPEIRTAYDRLVSRGGGGTAP